MTWFLSPSFESVFFPFFSLPRKNIFFIYLLLEKKKTKIVLKGQMGWYFKILFYMGTFYII